MPKGSFVVILMWVWHEFSIVDTGSDIAKALRCLNSTCTNSEGELGWGQCPTSTHPHCAGLRKQDFCRNGKMLQAIFGSDSTRKRGMNVVRRGRTSTHAEF